MNEKIFKVGFSQFLKTPFSAILIGAIVLLCWLGKYLLTSKENEILEAKERIKDCDQERKHDKILMQEIIFEKKRNEELNEK
ncbi:MAG: hypothetical protein Unbinned2819contig1004_24 [Prokaryotic dsDNA virus sp.]|jgi:hypothetical protein|nr:MAG: hypothetical protein Unbinned2819contig1004_24 [Prokaryotic dsDNA virus sp.]|tara:strand:- start:2188 stop:2433 length:246 start_codon:yes stop_codon:yes gene_type:complete